MTVSIASVSSIGMSVVTPNPVEVVRVHMGRYLGPFTSRNAVQLMAKQKLGMDPDQVTREQVPALLEALGPMLRTLLGKNSAESLVGEIARELAL